MVKEELFSSSLITLEKVLVPHRCWMLLLLMSLSSSIMNLRPSNSHILGKCLVLHPYLKLYYIFKMLDLNWCTLVLNLSFSCTRLKSSWNPRQGAYKALILESYSRIFFSVRDLNFFLGEHNKFCKAIFSHLRLSVFFDFII